MNENNTQPATGASFFTRLRNRFYSWWKKWRFRIEIFFLIIVISVTLLWDRILITIHSGEMGVHFKRFGGTIIDRPPMKEGLHIVFPLDIVTIYDVRQQEYKKVFDVISKDGLCVSAEVSIRYHPSRVGNDLNLLHVFVGPDYLKRVIIPEVEAALRYVIGKIKPEELYQADYTMIDDALSESLLQLTENHIILDDLLITKVTLPTFVQKAIEEKLTEYHNAEKYQYLLKQAEEEAKRKVILATGIRDFQDIVAEGISPELLRWRGIEATLELAVSPNAKVVIIGSAKDGLPLILNTAGMDTEIGSSGIKSVTEAAGIILNASGNTQIQHSTHLNNFDFGKSLKGDKEPFDRMGSLGPK